MQAVHQDTNNPAKRGTPKKVSIEAFCPPDVFISPLYALGIRMSGLGSIRQAFFSKTPASTLVEVSALAHPDWLIEIEAIAVL